MYLYVLIFQKVFIINYVIYGNFFGFKQQEIVILRGKIIEFFRFDLNIGKVFLLLVMEMFGVVRDFIVFRFIGGLKGKCICYNFLEVDI